MIWTKTAIGRAEIGARALVHERARRNLLLLIDGVRSQDTLLGSVAGIGPADFDQLARLGLISHGPADTATPSRLVAGDEHPAAPSYGQLTTRLTQLISSELGLRGFRLTLAVEKAADARELAAVAWQVLAEIAKRKGDEAAERARRSLHGT